MIALIRFIFTSFFEPAELWKATQLNRKKSILLFLLLAFIISIPFFVAGFREFQYMAADAEKIEERLPKFIIEDGHIHFEEPLDYALVARTDSINLIIDLNNQYEDRQEQKDVQNARISLIFKEDHFLVHTSQVPFQISYQNASGLTDQFFRTLLVRFSSINAIMMISLLVGSFFTGAIEAAVRYLFFSLAANIFSLVMKFRLPFSFNWKIMMTASVIPTLVFSLLNSFLIFPNGQLFILLIICLYMYRKGIVSHFKNLH